MLKTEPKYLTTEGHEAQKKADNNQHLLIFQNLVLSSKQKDYTDLTCIFLSSCALLLYTIVIIVPKNHLINNIAIFYANSYEISIFLPVLKYENIQIFIYVSSYKRKITKRWQKPVWHFLD